ncbi:hypothetical protein [Moorena sp. SIO3H5]|uniref:hypothetical protein n=1 Tax=Moorena sp. SIO3H5 TaxID=2607834 RepID=UPI0013BC0C26|nr:hypothetical protein [Moorena sp. SIO3H5]NEO72974.1 hypothetical protein [Moorena sp. SIO3H5]
MTEIKRLNYFTSQFLVENDFEDEQAYHRRMRHLHNRSLHTWGVVEGLEVIKSGDKQVSVNSGLAIDSNGKEIVVIDEQPAEIKTVSLSEFEAGIRIYITIGAQDVEDEQDSYTLGSETKYTRTTERPQLEARSTEPGDDGAVILLAEIQLDTNGNVEDNIDNSVRRLASVNIPPGSTLLGPLTIGEKLTVSGDFEVTGNVNAPLNVTSNVTISENLTVDGNIRTSGMITGSSMPPNLIRNSYMNILDGNKPAGYTTQGNVTLEAAHPFTKGFEGPYVGEKPANAADSVDDATEENPYWFGRSNKGARIKRGGLAGGWVSFNDGRILKITGDNSGESTIVYFPFDGQGNILSKKYVHFKAWLKISSGKQVKFGENAGLSNNFAHPHWGIGITKEQSDNAPDGWYRVDLVIPTSEVTKLGGQSFSMGIEGDEDDGLFEVYLALPYLANLDNDSWLPSVSDMLSRDGLTVHPTSGNVGIGTTNPSTKLEVDGTVKATKFEGDGSGLTGISAGQWSNGSSNRIYYNAGNVGIGTDNPTEKLEVDGTVKATKLEVNETVNINGRILRNGQDFSKAGYASHNDIVTVPWGTTRDWNIFVSPRVMGLEEPRSEGDNALLKIECWAIVNNTTSWKIHARYKYKVSQNSDGRWFDENTRTVRPLVNYILIPR